MSDFDREYYFIRAVNNDNLPILMPDKNTEDRSFRYEKQHYSSAPLIFFNGAKDYQKDNKIRVVKIPPSILFDGADLIVPSATREALLALDIPNLYMHPAVYIHDDNKWYEDYWYLTFTDRLDCWDRNTSNYEKDVPPIQLGGAELYQIYTYSLSDELLSKIPLEQRLLFKMGGSLDPFIVCHSKVMKLFSGGVMSGAKLTLISDY